MADFQAALGQGTRGQRVPTLRETALCVSVWVWGKRGTVGWALAAHASVSAVAEGSLKGGQGLLSLLLLPAFADGFAAVGRGVAVVVFNGGGGVGCLAAVGFYAGKVHHQPFGGFDVFADFIGAHPEGVVFFVGGFKGVGLGFDEEFFAVSVYGEVFELGLGFEGFGVVKMQFGAAADGAEYVYIDEYVGIGFGGGNNVYAAQEEDGLQKVGEEVGIAGVGGEGFVAVVAHAVEVEADVAAAACAVVSAAGGGWGVERGE